MPVIGGKSCFRLQHNKSNKPSAAKRNISNQIYEI